LRRSAALAAVVLIALGAVGAALAITYGEPDNGRHPNVAAIIRLRDDGAYRILCTGSLVTDRYVLTASHCTSFVESLGQSDIWVTFDEHFTQSSKLLHGSMITNPLYNQRQSDPEDIALIRLDKKVTGITPVQLPQAGLLDAMKKARTLNGDTQFTSVGYGIQEPQTAPGGITHDFPMERWLSIGTFSSLDTIWLRIAQTQATGDGGTCSGDSGGPQFLGGPQSNLQVSITITGDLQCFATNVDYRLDTPEARSFLGQYIPLP
jgi:secreted trypsin-like serine protease